MNEYTEYDFTLSPEQIADLVKEGMNVMVVVNGMYYQVKEEGEK